MELETNPKHAKTLGPAALPLAALAITARGNGSGLTDQSPRSL